jgi:hypothetical protein
MRERQEERVHQSEEVAAEPRKKFYLSHKEILDKGSRV